MSTIEIAGVDKPTSLVVPVRANGTVIDPAAMVAAIGDPADEAWNGSDASATVISLLKAIALNTTPTP